MNIDNLSTIGDDEIIQIGDIIERRLGPLSNRLRIYNILIAMFIGKVINVSSGGLLDATRQRRNIGKFSNENRVYFNQRGVSDRQTAGLKILYLVKVYGWAVLLCDSFNITSVKYLSRDIFINLNADHHYKMCIDSIISSDEAKASIVTLMGVITGNVGYTTELVRRIEEGITFL